MNSRPQLRFHRPSGRVEDLRRMEQAEGECQRSAERMRYLFGALVLGASPLALFVLGGVGSLIPFAGPWIGFVLGLLGFVSLVVLLPAQFAVFQKACNSMHLRKLDRTAVGAFCAFFSFAPVVTLLALAAWAAF